METSGLVISPTLGPSDFQSSFHRKQANMNMTLAEKAARGKQHKKKTSSVEARPGHRRISPLHQYIDTEVGFALFASGWVPGLHAHV